jgi:glycosyltransferase involved in cell wall biosynthesis
MDGKIAVTVIIPCFNTSKTLRRCWSSLNEQTLGLEHLQCIFVDDASTDDGATWMMLQSIEAEAPKQVAILQLDQNMKQGGARNAAIPYATGKYLQFMDADDELTSDMLGKLYQLAEQHETDIIQFNHCLDIGGRRVPLQNSKENGLHYVDESYRRQLLQGSLLTCGCTNKFYRMDFVRKAGVKFAEHCFYEEPLFVYPLFLYLKKYMTITDAPYIYYVHPGSTATSRLASSILDHPTVQFETLQRCMEEIGLYQKYRDDIALYFFWSFIGETLLWTVEKEGAVLPLEYFREMQNVFQNLFPDWHKIADRNGWSKAFINILKGCDKSFQSQKELNGWIHEAYSVLHG